MLKRPNIKFRDIKVLIADDCEFNRDILTEMLKLMGIDSDSALDGVEVLEMVNDNQYDMILMDIQMPNKDGITTSKELKQFQKETPPIIAVSANDVQDERKKCILAGMDDYIIKPVTIASLEELFKKYFKDKLITIQ